MWPTPSPWPHGPAFAGPPSGPLVDIVRGTPPRGLGPRTVWPGREGGAGRRTPGLSAFLRRLAGPAHCLIRWTGLACPPAAIRRADDQTPRESETRRREVCLQETCREDAHPDDGHLAAAATQVEERRPLTPAEAARFRETMLPHLDAAYTLARYLSRDADAAGDIVQDAYLRAYRAFPDFRGASPRAWLLAIVRNCHLSWHDLARRERLRQAPEPPAGDADGEAPGALDLVADGETPESILLRRSEAEAVRALLEQLPDALREVLVLRELEELSYREIAEVAAVPMGTVMSRLARARRLFAQLWQQGAGTGDTP